MVRLRRKIYHFEALGEIYRMVLSDFITSYIKNNQKTAEIVLLIETKIAKIILYIETKHRQNNFVYRIQIRQNIDVYRIQIQQSFDVYRNIFPR